jgi:hypothetical protein
MTVHTGRPAASHPLRRLAFATALVAAGIGFGASSQAVVAYATPDAALQAFRAAVDGEGGKGLLDLFGREYEADLIGGDPAEARQNLASLRRMAAQGMTLTSEGEARMTIVMGRRGWPMPVPLIKGPDGWRFDVKEGIQEITDRRVGRNELAAIDFCRAFIDAQRQYVARDHDQDGVLEFAQRLQSSEGKQDGLYWQAGADGVVSPLGPFAAASEQYLLERKAGEPFHGYYFRVLKEQGDNPPGGRYNYLINGNMIAGFAMIGWPADYRRSGIMTFQCGHNGQILQKDLGPDTAKLASAITDFDPDKSWVPAEAE